MITFKSRACLNRINPVDPSFVILDRLLSQAEKSNPEHDGFLILVQPSDINAVLDEWHPGATFQSLPYEGVHYKDNHYIAVTLLNNQASLVWVFPDAEWLPDNIRLALEDNLVPTT